MGFSAEADAVRAELDAARGRVYALATDLDALEPGFWASALPSTGSRAPTPTRRTAPGPALLLPYGLSRYSKWPCAYTADPVAATDPYRVPAGVVDPHRSVGAAVVDVEARNGIADGLADLAGKARDRSSAAHHDVRAVGGEVDITQVGLTLGGVRGARLGQRVVLPGVQGRGRLSEVDDEGPVPQLPRHRGEVADSGQLRPG